MVTLTYHLTNGVKVYLAEKPTLERFKNLYQEFRANGVYNHYDLFIYGGFTSYVMRDPQWETSDVNIFIGRKKILDTQELYELLIYLLELGEKYKLKLDIRYFTEHETPFTLKWGCSVQFLSVYDKIWTDNFIALNMTKGVIEIDNNLFVVNTTYQMSEKDLVRLNKGLTLYKGVNLKKHKF